MRRATKSREFAAGLPGATPETTAPWSTTRVVGVERGGRDQAALGPRIAEDARADGVRTLFVAPGAGGRSKSVPADSTWRLGAWHRIRIQLFPDGECGIAIDGVPVWRSPVRLPADQPYRTLIAGNSIDTKMLAGPLQVWRGVWKDIDWAVGGPRSSGK